MKEWLEKNYKGDNQSYLEDIQKAEEMFKENRFEQREISYTTGLLRQKQSKRSGADMIYSNKVQSRLQDAYKMNYAISRKNIIKREDHKNIINKSSNKNYNNIGGIKKNNYNNNEQNKNCIII